MDGRYDRNFGVEILGLLSMEGKIPILLASMNRERKRKIQHHCNNSSLRIWERLGKSVRDLRVSIHS
jgi:hypothetical protein